MFVCLFCFVCVCVCVCVQTLIRLPSKISDSEYVQDFFEIRQTDLEKPK